MIPLKVKHVSRRPLRYAYPRRGKRGRHSHFACHSATCAADSLLDCVFLYSRQFKHVLPPRYGVVTDRVPAIPHRTLPITQLKMVPHHSTPLHLSLPDSYHTAQSSIHAHHFAPVSTAECHRPRILLVVTSPRVTPFLLPLSYSIQ